MKIKLYDLIGIKSGMNFYLEAFYKLLEDNGIQTDILSNYSHNNKKQQLPNIFPKSNFKKLFNLLICYLKLILFIFRLKKNEFIIVMLYGTHLDFPLFIIGKLSKRVIFDVHEIMALDYKNATIRKILYYFYKNCLNKIIAHSEKIRGALAQLSNRSEIVVVPLFPNYNDTNFDVKKLGTDVTDLFENDNSVHYLFFGNIRPSKGIFDLLAATALFQNNNIKIIIAGQDIFNNIKEYKDTHVINENIKLVLRLINDDEMKYLFIKSDVTLLPYGNISQSGVLQTAVSLKIPLLTSDIEYFKSVIEEFPSFGKYTNTTDPETFKNSLVSLAAEISKEKFYTEADIEKYYQNDRFDSFAKYLKEWLPKN